MFGNGCFESAPRKHSRRSRHNRVEAALERRTFCHRYSVPSLGGGIIRAKSQRKSPKTPVRRINPMSTSENNLYFAARRRRAIFLEPYFGLTSVRWVPYEKIGSEQESEQVMD